MIKKLSYNMRKYTVSNQVNSSQAIMSKTPIADFLLETLNKNIISFHALPLYKGKSIINHNIAKKYLDLFGQEILNLELSMTSPFFDDFFFPNRIIREAQELASKAFGSKRTFFITTGTTTSCEVCADALSRNAHNSIFAIDRGCYKSLYFAIYKKNNDSYILDNINICPESDRYFVNIDSILNICKKSKKQHKPLSIILNATSYDGVIYNIQKIMEICLEEYENINFIIDEAWGAINYFHPFFKKFTAMEAVKYFSKKGIKVSIISFQSGHKSLSVLRQGSFINVYTCDSIIKDIEKSIFKIHTTSPNYSILALASLETKGSKQRGQIYLFLYSRLRLTAFQTENK